MESGTNSEGGLGVRRKWKNLTREVCVSEGVVHSLDSKPCVRSELTDPVVLFTRPAPSGAHKT